MTATELADILEAESSTRRRAIRRHATRERMERAARLVVERMDAGGPVSGSDDSLVNDLQERAIAGEPVEGIGSAAMLYLLKVLFSWAIRRAIQIWRERHAAANVATTG